MKKKKLLTRQLCKKCSQNQESCCTYYVPLTIKDVGKIIKLGFDLKESTEISQYAEDELLGEEDWWIKNLILVDNNPCRLTTRLTKENKCFFLKDGQGCVLGKNRPTECKLFPFWFEKNKLVYQDNSCYLVKNGVPENEILKIIGENKKSVKKHFLAIKNDFVKNKKIHQRIIQKLIRK